MSIYRIAGIVACAGLILSCFTQWAFYPDIEKYFTAFFSEKNYYGKPGKLLIFFASMGILFFMMDKMWTRRLNLLFSALNMAYAIKTYLLFTSGYDGFVPQPQWGIYLMLICCAGFLIAAVLSLVVIPNTKPSNQ